MREIKFRAWDKAKGKMLYSCENMREVDEYDKDELWGGAFACLVASIKWCQYSGYEIMQYTGLKDKNGVEIYEGDIWKRGKFTATVEFVFSAWTLMRTSTSHYEYPSFYSNANQGEVIGNIYENKKLLS